MLVSFASIRSTENPSFGGVNEEANLVEVISDGHCKRYNKTFDFLWRQLELCFQKKKKKHQKTSTHGFFYYFHQLQSVIWNCKWRFCQFFMKFTRKGSEANGVSKLKFCKKILTNVLCVYSNEVTVNTKGEIVLLLLTSHYVAPSNDYLHGLIINFKDKRVCSLIVRLPPRHCFMGPLKHTHSQTNVYNRSICENTIMWHIKLVPSRYCFCHPPPFPNQNEYCPPFWMTFPPPVLFQRVILPNYLLLECRVFTFILFSLTIPRSFINTCLVSGLPLESSFVASPDSNLRNLNKNPIRFNGLGLQ